MNHEKARELLSDFRDGELPQTDREALTRHLAVCRECRDLLLELGKIADAFFPAAYRPTEAETESFVQKVMGQIHRGQPVSAIFNQIDYRWFVPALGFSFAALFLSFISIGTYSADPPGEILLGDASRNVFVALISAPGPQTPEDMLRLVMEGK